MSTRQVITGGLIVGVAVIFMAPVAAQKNKATSRTATATFRCNEGGPQPCGESLNNPDGVLGEVSAGDYRGTGSPGSGQGAHLTADGELWIGLRNGLDVTLNLDPLRLHTPGSCGTGGNRPCRFAAAGLTSPLLKIPVGGLPSTGLYAQIQGNVVSVTATGEDTSPTMVSMGPGQTLPMRLNILFHDAVWGLLWGFNFNASWYTEGPGATNAWVTKENVCTWKVWADGTSRAGLSGYGSSGGGKAYRTNEGLYIAPFEISFSVASLCTP
jgi:hypothetical protein